VVMVTHDPIAAAYTDRVLFLADGKVVDELRGPDRETVLARMARMDAHQPAISSLPGPVRRMSPGRAEALWWAAGVEGGCDGRSGRS